MNAIKLVSDLEAFCYDEAMKLNKQSASIVFTILLISSVYITWKALEVAGDSAYSVEQPNLWVNGIAFIASIGLVALAIFIKTKYGR